jgi:hypothetical protein
MKSYIAFGATTFIGVTACILYSINLDTNPELFLSECFNQDVVYEDRNFNSIYLAPLLTVDGKEVIFFEDIEIKGNSNESNENSRR